MTHTPGPWRATKSSISFVKRLPLPIEDGGGITVYAEGFRTVCHLSWCGAEDRIQKDAAAALIAVAPELLEAGEAVIEHMEWSTPQGRAAYHALKAAIAKATNPSRLTAQADTRHSAPIEEAGRSEKIEKLS